MNVSRCFGPATASATVAVVPAALIVSSPLDDPHSASLVRDGSATAILTPEPATLTHAFLLSQTASIALDSSLNVLNRAVLATLDAHSDYQKVTHELIDLMEESLVALGNEFEQERLWDMIVVTRSLMEDRRKIVQDCDILMTSAIKLVTSAAETAFMAGCHDYVSTSASERIFFAEREVNAARTVTGHVDVAYSELNARSVQKISEHDQKRKTKQHRTSNEDSLDDWAD